MESVGRLAGGVAHDYNNALSVIMGYTKLVMERIDPAEPLYANLKEVLKAARRATDITRQLLAFARKQIIAPKVIDLNKTVEPCLKCSSPSSVKTSRFPGCQEMNYGPSKWTRPRLTRSWLIYLLMHGMPSPGSVK